VKTVCRSRWFLPSFCVALGAIVFGAQAVGGQPGSGAVSFGILAAFGAVILFGGRSETIRGLRGDGSDERFRRMDINATAFAGFVVIVAIIVAFVVSLAQGHDGNPYAWLGAVAGFAYMGAIVALRVRG
jgi:drug/metabolite transporter (DMT)-like permease